jgi:hypothetical protein
MADPIIYTGRNGTDLLLLSGAVEMEEDFSGDEITLTMADGTTQTIRRGEAYRAAALPTEGDAT